MSDSSSTPTPASSGRPNHLRGIPQGIAYAPPLFLIVSKILLAHDPTHTDEGLYIDDLVTPVFPDLKAAYDRVSHDMVHDTLLAMTRTNPSLWAPASPEDMHALD